jgi:hypothetical protein
MRPLPHHAERCLVRGRNVLAPYRIGPTSPTSSTAPRNGKNVRQDGKKMPGLCVKIPWICLSETQVKPPPSVLSQHNKADSVPGCAIHPFWGRVPHRNNAEITRI